MIGNGCACSFCDCPLVLLTPEHQTTVDNHFPFSCAGEGVKTTAICVVEAAGKS